MAGVSSKEIRQRIRSMKSTRQITKAMEMVASSKLRRAQTRIASARPYFETLQNTIGQIAAGSTDITSPYLQARPGKKAFVVIAGDRGLAGGYNSNLLKLCLAEMDGQDAAVLPIGKKALEFFASRKIPVLTNHYATAEDISVGDCFSIAKQLCDGYLKGEFGAFSIVYTQFISVLVQEPASLAVLPLQPQKNAHPSSEILYEPDADTVLNTIVPEFVGGLLYGALCESRAAEQAARRSAMDAATQNADEMIDTLNLKYNQVRQAVITQEITEIIAGS